MILPPASAVFLIASKTQKRLKMEAWQPRAKPEILTSSGKLEASAGPRPSMGRRLNRNRRRINDRAIKFLIGVNNVDLKNGESTPKSKNQHSLEYQRRLSRRHPGS